MRLDDFTYDLPPDRVAQTPAPSRENARLLVLGAEASRHLVVRDLPALLAPGDLLVVNDTRVLPARLVARRPTGGRVEVFCVEELENGLWEALLRAGGRPQPGEVLALASADGIRLVGRRDDGRWLVEGVGAPLRALLARHGRMPLPPYIQRTDDDARAALDKERYQTVFASEDGAVAAPTAGLHLTTEGLEALAARGVDTVAVTLHVGPGTFEPVRTEQLEDHTMHEEAYVVPASTADAVRRTRAQGGRVVAVGTTSVRALEASAAAAPDGLPVAGGGRTGLFILPGYAFRAVDAMLTNFHLPGSTLLALVSAFAGRERVLAAYREAVEQGYRFYSYGDAMFLPGPPPRGMP